MKLMALIEDTLDSSTSLHLRQNTVDGIEFGAIFDVNDRYRYSLWRAWSAHHPRVAFILLNPSTADEQRNDPTIRRCMRFARAWNFGSMEVLNLFAFRATDYKELFRASDPIGQENSRFLLQEVQRCSTVVLGWGTRGKFLSRDRQVIQLLADRKEVYCLGLTKDGQPRHPLYIKGDTKLEPFDMSYEEWVPDPSDVGELVSPPLIPTYCTTSASSEERRNSHHCHSATTVILSASEESHCPTREILRWRSE
jgi:hypothetical protein